MTMEEFALVLCKEDLTASVVPVEAIQGSQEENAESMVSYGGVSYPIIKMICGRFCIYKYISILMFIHIHIFIQMRFFYFQI